MQECIKRNVYPYLKNKANTLHLCHIEVDRVSCYIPTTPP